MAILTKRTLKIILIFLGCLIFISSVGLNFYFIKGGKTIIKYQISAAENIAGLEFTSKERSLMLGNLKKNLGKYQKMRDVKLENSVAPAIIFNPIVTGMSLKNEKKLFKISNPPAIKVPANLDELAFAPIPVLAQLIKKRQITSTDLTKMYISRLKKYGPQLQCTITLMEDLAYKQAKKADEEIAAGKYRGLLHGIPWGAKDLLATKGAKTTWGATPFKEQFIDEDATVVKKLDEAGAILVAKLTLGALAMGDTWFDGKTRNPWNIKKGSSGSSAGPAAAVSAGLVAFAIGSETWGSIVSPSTVCGATGLRPTFGRVSRYGAMALSWTMDKLGPICRNAEDCAIVFNAIYGPDDKDLTVHDYGFNYNSEINFKNLKIGYLKTDFESEYPFKKNDSLALEKMRQMGATLVPLDLPDLPVSSLSIILSAESAAAFDELTRSNRDDLLVRQAKGSWPNSFRSSRFIPAVEYINANRVRTLVMQQMEAILKNVDLYVSPSWKGINLLLTNLTGHPCVVVPTGFTKDGTLTSICFFGKLFDESKILATANAFQKATDFHLQHPKMEWVEN